MAQNNIAVTIDISKFDNFLTALEGITEHNTCFTGDDEVSVTSDDVLIRKQDFDLLMLAFSTTDEALV